MSNEAMVMVVFVLVGIYVCFRWIYVASHEAAQAKAIKTDRLHQESIGTEPVYAKTIRHFNDGFVEIGFVGVGSNEVRGKALCLEMESNPGWVIITDPYNNFVPGQGTKVCTIRLEDITNK